MHGRSCLSPAPIEALLFRMHDARRELRWEGGFASLTLRVQHAQIHSGEAKDRGSAIAKAHGVREFALFSVFTVSLLQEFKRLGLRWRIYVHSHEKLFQVEHHVPHYSNGRHPTLVGITSKSVDAVPLEYTFG